MPPEVKTKKPGPWTRQRDQVGQALRESLGNFFRQDSLTVSASIAYHGLLAIFPLMLLTLGLSGIAIRRYELSGRFAIVLERYLPMKPDFILRNLVGISQAYGRVGIISFLLLLWSSSGVFLPVEKALNAAWGVEKGRSWLGSRLLALEMALILGFVILVSSAMVGANVYLHQWIQLPAFQGAPGLLRVVYQLVIFAGTFALTLAMFMVLFQRLPNRPMSIRQALPSALLSATIWEIARSVFALLLPVFNYRHVYGSIGAVVALMTWAYVSSAVTLFGAQVSHSLYRTVEAKAPVEAEPTPSPVHSVGDV